MAKASNKSPEEKLRAVLSVLAVDRGLFSASSLAEATAVAPVVSYAKLESLAA